MAKRKCRNKKGPIVVHMDPNGRGGWVTFKRLPKGCKGITAKFDKKFNNIKKFRVPKKQRRYIYIVIGPSTCIYKLPRGCKAVILYNCGGAGVP